MSPCSAHAGARAHMRIRARTLAHARTDVRTEGLDCKGGQRGVTQWHTRDHLHVVRPLGLRAHSAAQLVCRHRHCSREGSLQQSPPQVERQRGNDPVVVLRVPA